MHLQVHAPSLLAAAAAPPCGLWRGRHSPLYLATTTAWLATSKHQRNASLALMMLFRAAGTKMAQSLIRPAVLVVYTKTLCCRPWSASKPNHPQGMSVPGLCQVNWSSSRAGAHALIHVCTHEYRCMHIHVHVRARTRTHTRARARARAHTHTHTRTQTYTRTHIRVNARARAHTHTLSLTRTDASTQTRVKAHART